MEWNSFNWKGKLILRQIDAGRDRESGEPLGVTWTIERTSSFQPWFLHGRVVWHDG